MFLTVMDAIWAQTDAFTFLVEGAGQDGLGCNWGDGFCVDPAKIASEGLSDPRPFFNSLAAKPYAQHVALGPHVYGPAVTGATANYSGQGLWQRLDASWGSQRTQGIPVPGGLLRLPVAIGEFGSKFEQSDDILFMTDFASYLNASGAAAGSGRMPVKTWFYWDWNANSGDTGGLVADNWKDIQWTKIRYLETIGLKPWYRAGPAPASAAAAPSPPAATPAGHPPAEAPAASEAPAAAPTTPPPAAPEASSSTTPAEAATGVGCRASVSLDHTWQEAGQHFATVNVFLNTLGEVTTPTPFALEIQTPGYTTLSQAWNMDGANLSGSTILASVTAPWASLVPGPHNLVNVGFVAGAPGTLAEPTLVKVNNVVCALGKATD